MTSGDKWQEVAIRSLEWLNVGLDAAHDAIDGGPGPMVAVSDNIHALCRDMTLWIAQNPRSAQVDWILVETVDAFDRLATMWAEQSRQTADRKAMNATWLDAMVVFVQALVTVRGEPVEHLIAEPTSHKP